MLKAQSALAQENISLEVIDLRTLSPLDTETILASVQKTGRAVIVQEAPQTCGLASEISMIIMEHALFNLKAPVVRVSGFDVIPPLLKTEDFNIPNEKRLIAGIRKTLIS
jgi:pyruvate dehydrogenase E1 component beta subunit